MNEDLQISILQVENLSVTIQSKIIFEDVSFEIIKGKHYAVLGPSGSGKTTLLRCLAGQNFHKGSIKTIQRVSVALVEQQHCFKNLSNTSTFYYQQRFNSIDAEDALSVKEYFENLSFPQDQHLFFKLLEIDKLWHKPLIQLSNGENKRVQLAKSLLTEPDILLLDNPFIGLDVETRGILDQLLQLIAAKGISIIMATSPALIPNLVTDVLEIKKKNEITSTGKDFFIQNRTSPSRHLSFDTSLLAQLITNDQNDFDYAIRMKNVHVQYSESVILDKINWEVRRGERWSLSGANGAGKSTLLSLINADNPQAYSNEIYLFDKRRGRGESIWDIKRRIGYVSPELHLYFEASITAFETVASGLFDTIGLFRQLNEEQMEKVKNWMNLLKVDQRRNQLLKSLSLGEQRLILLTRALVKDPPLLLLDEPTQGLDEEQTSLFKNIIEQICEHTNKTLIYVTHLKEDIPSCVSKFIHLEQGKVAL